MLKKILIIGGSAIASLLIIPSIWIAWQHVREPLDFIDLPIENVTLTQDSVFYDQSIIPVRRQYHKLIHESPDLGTISSVLSLPDSVSSEKIPALIILGGLEVDKRTLSFIPQPGNNALMVYQYPYSPRYWYYGSAVTEIPIIRRSVLTVPAQVTALYHWLQDHPRIDPDRINIAGYSFGALFVPGVIRLIQENQMKIDYTVLSYGGIDLFSLLVHNMTNMDQPMRTVVSWLAITAIRGIEPAYHLPFLKTNSYIINGTKDSQIPEANWKELHILAPEPKTSVILDEGHMHPRKPELTQKLVDMTKEWLVQKGAINK